ncbi:MAG: electron transport complex subunit RsxC, partial [Ferrimonas sp.]
MPTLLQQLDSGHLWQFPGGVHPPERKTLSNQTAIARLPLSPTLMLPLRQHIGAAGRVLVKVGDRVLKGQPLTEPDTPMAVAIHAPSSGIVHAIGP